MKRSIYFSGIACANLLMFGCMFKVQHWPGAGVLLTLSIFLFCFLFLPSALISSYRNREQPKFKLLHIVTFIVFFIDMMGVLFKVQHWPGASALLLIGIPLPFILFLPVYLYQTRNEKKNGNVNFLGIMFGLTFLAVFSVLLSLNVSSSVLDKITMNISNNDLSAFFNRPEGKDINAGTGIKQHSDELLTYIDNLKCELLVATQNDLCDNNALRSDYNSTPILNRENSDIPMHILYGEGENNKVDDLKTKINAYRESLLASGKPDVDLAELINSLFDVSDRISRNDNEPEKISWEHRTFSNFQLIVVMDVLSEIQSNIRLVESECLAGK